MKKITVFFLVTIFLCSNTSIGQLFKVPNLMEHYKKHKIEVANQSVFFIDFLKEHYSKNDENNQKEHQNLPFKTLDNTSSLLFTVTLSQFELIVKQVFFEVSKVFFYKNSFKSNLFTSIWLPPKLS